jgi:hypothetical protein
VGLHKQGSLDICPSFAFSLRYLEHRMDVSGGLAFLLFYPWQKCWTMVHYHLALLLDWELADQEQFWDAK